MTDLGGGVDGEAELGLLAVVDGQALQQQGAQARSSAATDSIEDQEALEACSQTTLPSLPHPATHIIPHTELDACVIANRVWLNL